MSGFVQSITCTKREKAKTPLSGGVFYFSQDGNHQRPVVTSIELPSSNVT